MEKAWSHFYKFIFCQSTLASSKAMPLPGSQPFGLVCERHSGNIIYRLCKARMIHFGWSPSGFICFLFSGIFFCIISFSGIYRSLPSLCSQENHQSHLSKSIPFLQKVFFFWHFLFLRSTSAFELLA